MIDACGHIIIPISRSLQMHTNRHADNDGNSFGWIDGCTTNIIWSNGTNFDEIAARKFIKEYNAAQEAKP